MASRTTTLLLLYSFACVWRETRGACNASWASAQLDALLAEYDREAAPSPAPVQVQLELDVRHAVVVEQDSTVRMLADLRLYWKDNRLSWNASAWGCESTLASAERLWLPDLQLINAAETAAGDPLRARIHSDGAVAWISRLDLSTPIALQLQDWPGDTQTCVFKFASRAHTIEELDLSLKEATTSTVFEAGAWEIASLTQSVDTWQAADGARRVGAYSAALRRRAPAHALAAGAVAAAAGALLLAAALLPPRDRPPLCACAAFTACLWLMAAALRLPGGGAAPRCVRLAGALCACAALAALGAALLRRLARCAGAPPAPVRRAVGAASALCRLTPFEDAPAAEGGGEVGAWAAAARLLDLALLAALAFVLLVLFAVYW